MTDLEERKPISYYQAKYDSGIIKSIPIARSAVFIVYVNERGYAGYGTLEEAESAVKLWKSYNKTLAKQRLVVRTRHL